MAHDLHQNTMLYVGRNPWHGLGHQLPENATWETVAEVGGFYRVREEPVVTVSGLPIPNRKALVREDTGRPLAVVSETYGVVQFEDVARTIVAAAEGVRAVFHTAGLLGVDGARGWLLAELPRVLRVRGDASEIRPFLLGTAAHDGHNGVVLQNVATRVVCSNTLGVALGEDSRFRVAIHHTKNAATRLQEAQQAFALLLAGMDHFEEVANALASTKFTDRQMARTVDDLLPLPNGKEEAGKQLAEKRERVLSLFETGAGINAAIRGTAWAAFQAWTEYSDHHRVVRDDDNGAKRLESIWFGRAADMKHDALASITKQIVA